MIFAFGEDGLLSVLRDEAAAVASWEAIDVENRVVVFYADDGTWLEPRFSVANRRHLFGLLLEQGTYELVRGTTRPTTVDSIEIALAEAVGMEPNSFFRDLEEVRSYVARVSCPPSGADSTGSERTDGPGNSARAAQQSDEADEGS